MRRARLGKLLLCLASAGWLDPACADTVDAAAKPYMVGGGWLVGLALVALGGFLVRKGVAYRRTAEAISGWPTVDGKVIDSGIRTRVDKAGEGPDITRYIPQVRYAYTAGGVPREGATIRIGLAEFGYTIERRAREHVDRYPAGTAVPVHYNPTDPHMAVLEAGQVGGGNKIVAGAILLAVGLGALVFAIWIGGLDAR